MIKYELKKITARTAVVILSLLCAVGLLSGIYAERGEKPEDYAEGYARTLDDIVYNAGVNYRRIADKKSAPARFQEEVIRRYGALAENDVSGEVRGWDALLSLTIPFAAAMAATAAAALTISAAEVRGDFLILSFHERRSSAALSKLAVIAASAVVFNVLAAASAALGISFSDGFAGGGLPIASIQAYMRCPYDITAAGGLFLRLAVSTLSSLAVGVLMMLAVFVLRRAVYVALAAVAVTAVDVTLYAASNDVLSFFYNFTFSGSVSDGFLTRFAGIGGGGIFLSRAAVLTVVPLILSAVLSACFIAAVVSYSGVRAAGKKRVRLSDGRGCGRGHGIVYYELRRVFSVRAAIAFAVLFALDAALLSYGTEGRGSAWERAYRQTVCGMEGMEYEEQAAVTEKEISSARADAAKLDGARELFEAGEISGEEYSEITKAASSAEFRLTVYESISEKLDFIGRYRPDVDGVLVYDLGWRALFSRGVDPTPALAALFVSVPYIFSEMTTGYERILTASLTRRERKKFARRKLAVSTAVSAAVLLPFFAAELCFIAKRFGFASWTKPAVGAGLIPPTGALPIAIVVLLRYAAYVLCTEAAVAVVFILCGFVSDRKKK